MEARELQQNIESVEAIKVTTRTGKESYRVELVMVDGTREVIKKKGTRAPSMVQLYNFGWINGNARNTTAGFFTFAKSIDSWHKESHLQSYPVTIQE